MVTLGGTKETYHGANYKHCSAFMVHLLPGCLARVADITAAVSPYHLNKEVLEFLQVQIIAGGLFNAVIVSHVTEMILKIFKLSWSASQRQFAQQTLYLLQAFFNSDNTD